MIVPSLVRVLSSHTVLLGVLTATVVEFNKVSPQAAYLLLPYLGWSTFAAGLTLDIWKRNPKVTSYPFLCCLVGQKCHGRPRTVWNDVVLSDIHKLKLNRCTRDALNKPVQRELTCVART
jgi:hypothetical protein